MNKNSESKFLDGMIAAQLPSGIFIPGHHEPSTEDLLPEKFFRYTGNKETSDYSNLAQPWMVPLPINIIKGEEIIPIVRQYFVRSFHPGAAGRVAAYYWDLWEKQGHPDLKIGGRDFVQRLTEKEFQEMWKTAKRYPHMVRMAEGSSDNPVVFTFMCDTGVKSKETSPELYVTLPKETIEL